MNDCIITQVHIPDYDIQGSLCCEDKKHLVEFGILHLRKFNPNSYIIISGHGHRPSNLDLCDHVYWEDVCRPIDQHGYIAGMPAQYFFVSKGLQHAISLGYKNCLKTRGDCIIGIPNITNYCNDILNTERKQLLITQQTGVGRLGDCLMYGDTDLLNRTWHENNQVWNYDGLQNTAINYYRQFFNEATSIDLNEWKKLLQRTCAFRDVIKLKFTCLRWNYRNLQYLNNDIKSQLLNPNFDFNKYHWGKANGWHVFNSDGSIRSAEYLWSEKDFYNE